MKNLFRKTTALFLTFCMIVGMTGLPITAYAEGLDSGDGDAAIVAADKDALAIGFADGDSAGGVTGNLILVTTGASGSSIAWLSDTPEVIDHDGTVTRPDAEDAEVTLTATITSGEASDTKEFTVTVLKEPAAVVTDDTAIVAADKAALEIGFSVTDSVYGVTADLTLPLTGVSGSAITWLSDTPEVIANDGAVTRPAVEAEDAEVTLTAAITSGEASDTKEFTVTVLKEGDLEMLLGPMSTVEWVGDGLSADTAFQVSSAAHLADIPNQGMDKYYIQTANIDLLEAGYTNWTPIGTSAARFTGTYNGNNKTVSNLNISNDTLTLIGLFGTVGDSGRLENITLENASVSADTQSANIGSLVGYNRGIVNNCKSEAEVTGGEFASVGGLVGSNAGTISDSQCTADITGIMSNELGGLVGGNRGIISHSSSAGSVIAGPTSTVGWRIGGLTGTNSRNANISFCYNNADVTCQDVPVAYVGGIAGENDGTISDSNNTGEVINTAPQSIAGGIAGFVRGCGIVERCNNSGTISGYFYIGGIAGYVTTETIASEEKYGLLDDCYNTGYISSEKYAGGVAGALFGTMDACRSSGDVFGKGEAYAGGLIGRNNVGSDKLTGSYSTGNISGDTGSTIGSLIGKDDSGAISLASITITAPADKTVYSVGEQLDITGLAVLGNYAGNNTAVLPITAAYITGFDSSAAATGQELTITYEGKTVIYTVDVSMPDWVGEGTFTSPYQVSSWQHLMAIFAKDMTAYYIQTANIDLTGINWTPIGAGSFSGTYDGLGHTISNLTIDNSTLQYVGLFSRIENEGVLRNIQLANIEITALELEDEQNAGALAGSSSGSITGCNSTGTISCALNPSSYIGASIGGLVGRNGGTIENSYSAVEVDVEAAGFLDMLIGGLVGFNDGEIARSYSSGSVTVSATAVNPGRYVNVGGLVGINDDSLLNCYSIGDVTLHAAAEAEYATAGGVAGMNYEDIANCYSTGLVSATGGVPAGGLLGKGDYGTISNCYYLNTAADISAGGDPLTDAQMKQWDSFEGWNFDTVWKIGQNISYPTLQWQTWTPNEEITADLIALDWTDIDGANSAENDITSALSLVLSGTHGSAITWSASPSEYIDTGTGEVTRPTRTQGNKAVTLTATVSQAGGASQTKEFDLVIKYQLPVWQGDGTQGSPYQVSSADHLASIPENSLTAHYIQTENIDLTGINWTPIGDTAERFTGACNGGGYAISNLTIDSDAQNYTGLFGYVGSGGTLDNIRLTGVNISSTAWGAHVGGLAGVNQGTITDSSSEGSVTGGDSANVGGLIGNGGGVITYNYSAANVTGGNNANVGGLLGRSYVSTSDNYSTGTITGGDDARVGGLIGDVDDGTVTNSYSTGSASGGTGASLGGLIGGGNATVNDSYYLDTAGTSAGGTPLTAAQMKQWESFEGWDFDAVWYLSENIASPALRWQLLDVIYHANYAGGEAPVHTQRIAGETFTAAANAFTAPSGKQFKHWNTEPDGTGTVYAAGAAVTMPAEPLNLYAIWENKSGGGSSGGSSGSSGGGSSVTVPPAKKPDQPLVTSAELTPTVDKNGLASASVPDQAIKDAIAKAQEEAKKQGKTANGIGVSLDVKMPQGASALSLTLSQAALQSLTGGNVQSLEIGGGIASLNLDLEALKEIQKQSTGSVTITIKPVKNLSAAAKKLIGARPVYDVTVSYVKDGKTVTITSLGKGSAILSIPYAPNRNEAIGWLFGVYVDASGQATRIPGSAYDANSGSIILSGNHFSIYGVGYTAPTEKYTDIATHWAKESIDYVMGRGLFSGTTDTNFSPNTAMDRGMLVTVLGRLAGADVSAYKTSSFTDVAAGKYYLPYVEWAYKKGIISGIGNGKFAPERAVTREEIALILQNYAKATGYTLPVTREATTFADNGSIASAYANAIRAMQQAGIMVGGSGNKFNPKAGATRAEVAAMLHRYVKLTIDPATAQGWALNDNGRYMYYKDGKPVTGWQTIDGVRYHFYSTGILQTGWVKDGNNWRYYSGNKALTGWWNIGSETSKKRYYFDTNAVMVSGKWLQIEGKWYYFYADGSLARGTKIDGYEVDENGVRKTE